MGNQLSATPSVRIADVSSSLHLIAPLGGENRNFFSTFHCLDRTETHPLSLKLLVRCSRPDLYRIHSICNRNETICHTNFNNVYRHLEGDIPDISAAPQPSATDQFSPSGSLKIGFSNYTQLLLRRPMKSRGRDVNTDDDPKALGNHMNTEFNRACEMYRSGTWTLYSNRSESTAGNQFGAPRRRTTPMTTTSEPVFSPPPTVMLRDVVVKVFVRNPNVHDQALTLKAVTKLLHNMAEHIAAADAVLKPNSPISILFYDTIRSEDSDMFCLLQRPYIDFSLVERLATRPFYTLEDRLFACYQVLQGLVQLHEQYGMVHGDLKPSNVLVQSGSGWLYLSDIAPFKPSRVPAHNPAVFDYYYDTDDTRCCCLAPEKFYDSKLKPSAPLASALSTATIARSSSFAAETRFSSVPGEPVNPISSPVYQLLSSFSSIASDVELDNMNVYNHTPAMDVFSAGCVIVYLLTEEPAFSLSEVLQLRERDTIESRREFVLQILDGHGLHGPLLEMLLSMLCSLPDQRPSARQVLESFTPSVFPRSYRVLYERVLPCLLVRPPDHQVQFLFRHLKDILHECTVENLTNGCPKDESDEAPSIAELQESATYQLEAQRAVHILLPVLLHATRRASTDEATFRGVVCLHQVALPHCKLSTQLDLVLPHLLYIVNRRSEFGVNTRIMALRSVCEIVGLVVAQLSSPVPSTTTPGQYDDGDDLHNDVSGPNASAIGRNGKQTLRMSTRIQQTTLLEDLILPCICELLENSSREEVGVLTELATRLSQLLLEARFCLEQRQTIFGTYKIANRHGTFGQQLDGLCNNGWYMFQVLFRLALVPVSMAIMHQAPKVAAFLGDARTQEEMIPFLTTAISSPIPVRREVYPIAVLLHAVLQSPDIKTLHFFVDEGLRQRDAVCLKRTLDALRVVVHTRKFTAWDSMTLVHQALPLIGNPFPAVNLAARRVVEVAARTYRASEVMAYLECAIRPLLTQAVPLADLSRFPDSVIRQGFSFTVPDASGGPSSTSYEAAVAVMRSASAQRQHHPPQWKPEMAQKTDGTHRPPREFCYPTGGRPHHSTTALLKDAQNPIRAEDAKCYDALLDITLDAEAVWLPANSQVPPTHAETQVSSQDGAEVAASERIRRDFRYQPSSRELKRIRLRQSILSRYPSSAFLTSFPRSPSDALPLASASQPRIPSHRRDAGSHDSSAEEGVAGLGLKANSSPSRSPLSIIGWLPPYREDPSRRELRPVAAPLDVKWRHTGGIYRMEGLPGGRLLTAGASDEVMLWQFEADPTLFPSVSRSFLAQSGVDVTLKLMARVEPFDSATSEDYLTSCRVSSGNQDRQTGSSLIALGGTSGYVHLLDTNRSGVVRRWKAGEGERGDRVYLTECGKEKVPPSDAVMAMAMLEEHILLVATAVGSLAAFDVRRSSQQGAVWRTILDPMDGSCSALCPLYHGNRAYSFAAATYGGVARLYDLRFSGLCVCRDDVAAGLQEVGGSSPVMSYPVGGMDAVDRLPNSRSVFHGSSLGAQGSMKDRLSILCAAVDHTGTAFAMPLGGNHPASGRASPSTSSPELLFGMSDGSVCTLNLASGRVYPLTRPTSTAPTRTMLIQPAHGSLFTAGEDGYIRYWSTRQPTHSHTLCCPPSSVSSEYEAVCAKPSHLRGFGRDLPTAGEGAQGEQSASSGWRYYLRECPRFPVGVAGPKQRGELMATAEPQRHHHNAILSMTVIQAVEGIVAGGDRHRQFLASGARDGSLTIWANESP